MIRLTDATRLAVTKLRTRKVRLVVTVVIAGLLFSVLAAASQISRGAFDSFSSFDKEGFGNRYIIAANAMDMSTSADPFADPAVADRADALHKDLVARKTAEAKRLGIEYDPKAEQPATEMIDSPNGKIRSINMDTPAGRQALAEAAAAKPRHGLEDLKKQAAAYDPKGFYQHRTRPMLMDGPSLVYMKNGVEEYDRQKQAAPTDKGVGSFAMSWALMSRDLLVPFMLPGTSATVGTDGSIPVVAPYSAVEELLGLKPLPSSATPDVRLERISLLRSKASTLSFQVCYRNLTSVQQLDTAVNVLQELERNKNKKDYVKPSLQYSLPATPCTAAPVTKDTRTVAEKRLAEKQEQFDRLFGKPAPEQSIVKLRVIGIAPDPPSANASVAAMLIGTLVSSNLGFGANWFTPYELETQQPQLATIFKDIQDGMTVNSAFRTQYVEFNNAATAKRFIEKESCDIFAGPSIATGNGPDNFVDPSAECIKAGKSFGFMPFGSNALALESVRSGFNRVFGYAAIAVAAIAAIIMIGTVGRIIADSRRETAVFRAIGAKKADIALTYLIYTVFLSLLIFGFALIVGSVAAQFVQNRYSAELTVQALVAYNAQDLTKTFNLYNFYMPDIAKLLGLSLAGGFLSALFPLLRNLRRNPIRDMRDDT